MSIVRLAGAGCRPRRALARALAGTTTPSSSGSTTRPAPAPAWDSTRHVHSSPPRLSKPAQAPAPAPSKPAPRSVSRPRKASPPPSPPPPPPPKPKLKPGPKPKPKPPPRPVGRPKKVQSPPAPPPKPSPEPEPEPEPAPPKQKRASGAGKPRKPRAPPAPAQAPAAPAAGSADPASAAASPAPGPPALLRLTRAPDALRAAAHVPYEVRMGRMHHKTRKAMGDWGIVSDPEDEGRAGRLLEAVERGWDALAPALAEPDAAAEGQPRPETDAERSAREARAAADAEWQASVERLPMTGSARWSVLLKSPNSARLAVANWLRDGAGPLREADATFSDTLTTRWVPPVVVGEGEGKVVVEPYAGVGSLTRALLEHPPSVIKRLIAIEDNKVFLPSLRALAATDGRLHILEQSSFAWETYAALARSPLMSDVRRHPWEEVHPGLQLIARMPLTITSEQLISQFVRFAPTRAWLFQFGRFPMGFLLPYNLWDRMSAAPGKEQRCKLTIIASLACAMRLTLPAGALQPYAAHFHPAPTTGDVRRATTARQMTDAAQKNKGRQVGHPYVAASLLPRADQVIARAGLDTWDYVTRMLFIQRAKPLSTAINNLGLGAGSLLPRLAFDPATRAANTMDGEQWAQVVDQFADWPFAPSVYMAAAPEEESVQTARL